MEPIIGIDLGTTNSVVAVMKDGQPRVIADPVTGEKILPSVVGLDADGNLLVGTPARNQAALYPERTIRSVKRQMGREIELSLGDKRLTPPEVSAIILKTLHGWAEADLGRPVRKAVITVPAFFNETQREATYRAGQIAGLEVVRVINEPTAASLVYEPGSESMQQILVYDLGGGTFDVSVVQLENGVVEVLSSRGDTQLGGDDFDQLIAHDLANRIKADPPLDTRQEVAAWARLLAGAEEAKKRLSFHTFTAVREEFLRTDGTHLDTQFERSEFEKLVQSHLDRTIECVDQALADAKISASQLDRVVLVGGSTRSPIIASMLRDRLKHDPCDEVDPDLCVALGAAVQGGLISGMHVERVLVDITPHTLGIRCLGMDESVRSHHLFAPIIHRRTALPATRAETFYTAYFGQEQVEIEVYQGENTDVRFNKEIGSLMLEGLNPNAPPNSPVSVQFTLNLNGILEVSAVDRISGKSQSAKMRRSDQAESSQSVSNSRITELMGSDSEITHQKFTVSESGEVVGSDQPQETSQLHMRLNDLIESSTTVLAVAGSEDSTEIRGLLNKLRSAADASDAGEFDALAATLDDLLFYLNDA